MKEEDKSKLVEVFHGSLWEAELVKGLLTDRGIDAAIGKCIGRGGSGE